MLGEASDTWRYKCLSKLMKYNVRNVTSPSIQRSVIFATALLRTSRCFILTRVPKELLTINIIVYILYKRQISLSRASNTFINLSIRIESFQKKYHVLRVSQLNMYLEIYRQQSIDSSTSLREYPTSINLNEKPILQFSSQLLTDRLPLPVESCLTIFTLIGRMTPWAIP